MVFFLRKIFLSDEEIIPFKRERILTRAKMGANDVKLQYKLPHFLTSEKPKTANLIKCTI